MSDHFETLCIKGLNSCCNSFGPWWIGLNKYTYNTKSTNSTASIFTKSSFLKLCCNMNFFRYSGRAMILFMTIEKQTFGKLLWNWQSPWNLLKSILFKYFYGLCQDGQMTASSKNFQIAAFSSRHLSENRDLNQIMCNLSILGTMTMAVLVCDDFF